MIAVVTTKGHKMSPIISTKKINNVHVITNKKIDNQGQESINIYTRLQMWTPHNEAQPREKLANSLKCSEQML